VTPVGDPLDPTDELAAHAFESGLLRELTNDSFEEQFSTLDPSAGDRPEAGRRPVAATDEEELIILDHDGPDTQFRWVHGKDRWTMIALATMPADSKVA
jgi:hypothetical protein